MYLQVVVRLLKGWSSLLCGILQRCLILIRINRVLVARLNLGEVLINFASGCFIIPETFIIQLTIKRCKFWWNSHKEMQMIYLSIHQWQLSLILSRFNITRFCILHDTYVGGIKTWLDVKRTKCIPYAIILVFFHVSWMIHGRNRYYSIWSINAEDHTIRAWQSHPLVLVKTFKIDATPRKSGSRGDHDFNTLKPRDEYVCGSKLGQTRLRSCIVAYSAPNLGLTGWWFFVNIRASVKTESQYDTDQDTQIFIQWMNLKLSFEKYRPFYSDIGVLIMQQFLSKLRSNWIWNG